MFSIQPGVRYCFPETSRYQDFKMISVGLISVRQLIILRLQKMFKGMTVHFCTVSVRQTHERIREIISAFCLCFPLNLAVGIVFH